MDNPVIADVYQDPKQREMAARVNKLRHDAFIPKNKERKQELLDEADAISMELVRWLHKNYPDSFQSFTVNYKNRDYLPSVVPRIRETTTLTVEGTKMLTNLVENLNLKQDDIILFRAQNKIDDAILYMISDKIASFRYLKFGVPRAITDFKEKMGLTPHTASLLHHIPESTFIRSASKKLI